METQDIASDSQEGVGEASNEKETNTAVTQETEADEHKPDSQDSTSLTNDRIEKIIYAWIISLHISILLNWLGLISCWSIFCLTLGVASTTAILALATIKVSPDGRAVLITGCDSGFGHALALHLEKMGFTVIACCLFADTSEGAASLRKVGSENLHVIQMNICSEEEVAKARKEVDKILPEGVGLWGIVNNAGVSAFGELEWVPVSTFRKIAEVNMLGLVSATKAFLPLIRKAKGRVVNVSSMLGRMGGPMRSPYVMTKYGVEGLSECLRHEMQTWGVKVIVVEPGNFVAGTAIFTEESMERMTNEMWTTMTQEVKDDYTEEFFRSRVDIMKKYVGGGVCDITPVITSLTESLVQQYPQARYQPAEWVHKIRIFVATHLPEFIYDGLYIGAMKK